MRKCDTFFCLLWGAINSLSIVSSSSLYRKRSWYYLLILGLWYFPVNAKSVQDPFIGSHLLNTQATETQLQGLCYKVLPMGVVSGRCTDTLTHSLNERDDENHLSVRFDILLASEVLIASPAFIESLREFPYSRSYLQKRFMALWKEEQIAKLNLSYGAYVDLNFFEMLDYSKFEQIAISFPTTHFNLNGPQAGEYQYYSQQGHLLNNAMSFNIELPIVQSLSLSMKARWNIEEDYDYSQVLVDGVAIAGNHTKASNQISHARNILTGNSASIVGTTTEKSWVDLTYDLSGYAGRNVRITVNYVTDEAEGYDGILINNLAINQGNNEVFLDGAQLNELMSLVGFERIPNQVQENEKRYMMKPDSIIDMDLALYSMKNSSF